MSPLWRQEERDRRGNGLSNIYLVRYLISLYAHSSPILLALISYSNTVALQTEALKYPVPSKMWHVWNLRTTVETLYEELMRRIENANVEYD